jgi:FkbM family methyltransferase
MEANRFEILSSSGPAYTHLYESVDIFSPQINKQSFIYHSKACRSPWVIIRLGWLAQTPQMEVELHLYNRLIDNEDLMRSRVAHLEAYASKDAYEWRQIPFSLSEEFLCGASPISLTISTTEQFIRFCNHCDDPKTELTLGPLVLDSRSRYRLAAFSTSRFKKFCSYFAGLSNAQLLQDLLPLYFLGLKPGIFFEAGMANGITLSNSFILENLFGWRGIGIEPLPEFFLKARDARTNTHMYQCALVADETVKSVTLRSGGLLSSLDQAMPDDSHSGLRSSFNQISVDARSFMSIMRELGWTRIDFLSLDLEGHELPILKSIDFSSISVQIIAVEHNHTGDKALICEFLLSKGFIRVFEDISNHDDFYVHESISPFDWDANKLFTVKQQPAAKRLLVETLDLLDAS